MLQLIARFWWNLGSNGFPHSHKPCMVLAPQFTTTTHNHNHNHNQNQMSGKTSPLPLACVRRPMGTRVSSRNFSVGTTLAGTRKSGFMGATPICPANNRILQKYGPQQQCLLDTPFVT